MMVWADEIKKCEYCHEDVSIFESLTEYGKHFHEQCYIHLNQKKIEGYKKKWINRKMTDGDKVDLVETYNLVQKLMSERTEFKGFALVEEHTVERQMLTDKPDKRILYQDKNGIFPLLDKSGKLIFVEDKSPSMVIKSAVMRPSVAVTKTGFKPKLLTIRDIPLLMENLP